MTRFNRTWQRFPQPINAFGQYTVQGFQAAFLLLKVEIHSAKNQETGYPLYPLFTS